jgi:hypothetical protein
VEIILDEPSELRSNEIARQRAAHPSPRDFDSAVPASLNCLSNPEHPLDKAKPLKPAYSERLRRSASSPQIARFTDSIVEERRRGFVAPCIVQRGRISAREASRAAKKQAPLGKRDLHASFESIAR